jgi:uncharacterized protein
MLGQTHDDALDTGPRTRAAGAERLCAATHEVKPVEQMIRFVVAPDGAAMPDLKRRLPGRGLWITATRQALAAAVAHKTFARGFKREVKVAADLVEITERLLEQAALDALAICRKAGSLAIGFAKAEAALLRGPVAAVINAADAGSDGTRKLMALLRQRGDAEAVKVVDRFTSAQLDLALGRSNVVHAALLAGSESDGFLARVARLDCFRAAPMSGTSGQEGHRGRKSAARSRKRT